MVSQMFCPIGVGVNDIEDSLRASNSGADGLIEEKEWVTSRFTGHIIGGCCLLLCSV